MYNSKYSCLFCGSYDTKIANLEQSLSSLVMHLFLSLHQQYVTQPNENFDRSVMASDFLADNNLVSDPLKRSRKMTAVNDESYQFSSTQGIAQNVTQTNATYSTTNDLPRINIQQCNVLIVGKTGCGKSTVANHILGETHFIECSEPSSQEWITHKENHSQIEMNTWLQLKVIDTKGLYATGNFANKVRRYITNNIPEGISLVLFVYKKGRCTREEKEYLEYIISQFGKYAKDISALVITHCECETAEEREKIIEDFRTNPLTRNIAQFMGKGIITVGFPNTDKKPAYLLIFKAQIEEDEKALHDIIRQSSRLYLANELIKNEFVENCMIL